ncbi:hypothetical protein [Streptomyces beijiangensis]|uniref:Uncharacterized protein n=1 Tax=Streptomyces beijiangensis TaxID=163361 RepID=A0A939F5Y9_9ACTN|nr:hypothetical protein [Streptomyces beijiangensis]MBO0511632.1 hypothetical protein [Streptomyces beijiangensis]
MPNIIAHLFEWLLRFLFPASGRRRAADAQTGVNRGRAFTGQLPGEIPVPSHLVLRGEDVALVHPYLMAYEQRQEERLRRKRRRELRFAAHGIDIGPRLIHGVEVA